MNSNSDPYVKVYMIGSGKRLKKKKTTARKNTNNPVWNEAVSFSISPSALASAAVEVTILLRKFYQVSFEESQFLYTKPYQSR